MAVETTGTPESSGTLQEVMESKKDFATPDVHNVAVKIGRAKEVYKEFAKLEEKPSNGETTLWYLYGLCSYFIHTVLIPIVFPLIISQIGSLPPPPPQGWTKSFKGLSCASEEMKLYQRLTHPSITVNNLKFSSLELTALSWGAGIVIATPILSYIATHLDHDQNQPLIFGGATAIGALFCLPTGFFKTNWIFPLYIAVIVAANTLAAASHTRHLGLMIRGYTDRKNQFSKRRAVASRLSIYATVAGCAGAATISAFTYHMLRYSNKFVSLWIVSIFSGLQWLIGILHAITVNRPGSMATPLPDSSTWSHMLSIFKYPHAVGSLAGVFLSSFVSTCIFTGGVLYAVGHLCLKPVFVLYVWLIYFIFPLFSLPLLQPLQQIIKADAVQMQLLGFLLSAATSGSGFYFRNENWRQHHVLFMTAIQSTAAGVLHAFGRVLLLDCSPAGKEGVFSVWFSWVRAVGTCAGFAVASALPGNVSKSFGVAFCTTTVGICILIFGNISNFGGAKAAGHLREDESEKGSPASGLDVSTEQKGFMDMKMQISGEGRVEA